MEHINSIYDFQAYQHGNPFMEYNHIEIKSVNADHCVVCVELTHDSMNLHGTVHGGLLYSLADCVAGLTARTDGRDYVTQSAHINFLRNTSGGTVFAEGRIIKRGRRVAVIRVEITDDEENLLADISVDMICCTE